MPLRPLRAREVTRKLERGGYRLTRQRGSHARYVKGTRGLTVPIHPGDIPVPIIRSILKQAGISEAQWDLL